MWLLPIFAWCNLLSFVRSSNWPIAVPPSFLNTAKYNRSVSRGLAIEQLDPRDGCGFPWPSQQDWQDNKAEDTSWLRENLRDYKSSREVYRKKTGVRENFPVYMARKYAPGSPPSNFQCDGLNECQIDTCHNLKSGLTADEVRRVLLFFEFMSSINNSHRIVSDATQEAFVLLSSDLEWLAMEFTSADELQAKAIKRRETQEMIIGIITSLVTMATMAAGGIAFWAEPIVGATSQFVNQAAQISKAASSLSKLSSYAQRVGSFANLPGEAGKHGMIGVLQGVNSLAGVASGAYLSTSGLYKEYLKTNFKHDEEQFDNLLKLLRHDITLMAEGAFTATAAEMWALSTGEMSSSQLSLVDLYKSGFYFDVPAEVLRIDVSYMTKMYWTAAVIGPLWKTENAYISESDALTNGNCSTDTRGPQETKVCLEERPDHIYHIYAVTNWNDDKIHTIPGIQHLDGDGFRGLTKEIIVRSSLFKDEIWRASLQLPGDPDMSAILLQPLLPAETFDGYTGASQIQSGGAFSGGTNVSSEKVIKVLEHYGAIPGAISLPICRSWGGETISTVNTEKHRNAPCLCHPVRPSLASPWSSPDNWTLAYTDRFVLEGAFYRSEAYGELCNDKHDCKKKGTWAKRLNLTSEDQPTDKMKDAWGACEHKGHGIHPIEVSSSGTTGSPATSTPRPSAPANHNSTSQPVPTSPSIRNSGDYTPNQPDSVSMDPEKPSDPSPEAEKTHEKKD